jgi:hypothetical protein
MRLTDLNRPSLRLSENDYDDESHEHGALYAKIPPQLRSKIFPGKFAQFTLQTNTPKDLRPMYLIL